MNRLVILLCALFALGCDSKVDKWRHQEFRSLWQSVTNAAYVDGVHLRAKLPREARFQSVETLDGAERKGSTWNVVTFQWNFGSIDSDTRYLVRETYYYDLDVPASPLKIKSAVIEIQKGKLVRSDAKFVRTGAETR